VNVTLPLSGYGCCRMLALSQLCLPGACCPIFGIAFSLRGNWTGATDSNAPSFRFTLLNPALRNASTMLPTGAAAGTAGRVDFVWVSRHNGVSVFELCAQHYGAQCVPESWHQYSTCELKAPEISAIGQSCVALGYSL